MCLQAFCRLRAARCCWTANPSTDPARIAAWSCSCGVTAALACPASFACAAASAGVQRRSLWSRGARNGKVAVAMQARSWVGGEAGRWPRATVALLRMRSASRACEHAGATPRAAWSAAAHAHREATSDGGSRWKAVASDTGHQPRPLLQGVHQAVQIHLGAMPRHLGIDEIRIRVGLGPQACKARVAELGQPQPQLQRQEFPLQQLPKGSMSR